MKYFLPLVIISGLLACSNDVDPTVSFLKSKQSVSESKGTSKVTVVLTKALDKDVSIPFTVSGTATTAADYSITKSPITIKAGETKADITITVVDDGRKESNETAILTMGTPTNVEKGKITKNTVTISDTGNALAYQWISLDGDIYIADTYNCVIRKVEHDTGFISTVAGTGACGDTGEGGLATSATLNYPNTVALDADENMYIADTVNCKIKKVSVDTGIITTIAGDGTCSFAGDGGPATAAQLNKPMHLFVNGDGDVFVADTFNYRVRIITAADGEINTIAGSGTYGTMDGDGGLATAANLNYVYTITFDSSDNLYFAEGSRQIRKVDSSTGIISTIVGTGPGGNSGDGGLAVDALIGHVFGLAIDGNGDLLLSNSNYNRVRKVNASDGIINAFAGFGGPGYTGDGGDALDANLQGPDHITVDGNGDIYFYESGNDIVRKIDGTTNIISTAVGTGVNGYTGDGASATAATLNHPGSNYWWFD